ncbi:MAG: type transport system permease protein [Frankiales bacterium]|jgi:ABC-2 type transport system permease protein|nr:type transport system permease protein [Frankiales bacterium]
MRTHELAVKAPAVSSPPQPQRPSWPAAFGAVYAGQLARTRVVRVPLLFVAAFQSIGILVLLRVVGGKGSEGAQIVAGSTVLVVAFVGLNLLAQRFGALKANGGLDYYAALPVPRGVVVLATAASYATFAVPGTVGTAVAGVLMYDLRWAALLLLPLVVLLAGASLAGVGAAIGLLAPKPEIATVAGQLGMSAVIFLDLVAAHRLPVLVQVLRAVIPSTYAADALSQAFAAHPDGWLIARDLGVCAAVALAALALASWAFGKAVHR